MNLSGEVYTTSLGCFYPQSHWWECAIPRAVVLKVLVPGESTSPGNLIEMHRFGRLPRPAESEALGPRSSPPGDCRHAKI